MTTTTTTTTMTTMTIAPRGARDRRASSSSVPSAPWSRARAGETRGRRRRARVRARRFSRRENASESSVFASETRRSRAALADGARRRRTRGARAKTKTLRMLQDGEKTLENASGEEEGGLFALPFMAKALRKKREAAENEARALLEELDPDGEHHVAPLDHFAQATDFAFDDREGCCDLVVNASPLGMRGQPALAFDWSHAPPGSIAYDIVTDPVATPNQKVEILQQGAPLFGAMFNVYFRGIGMGCRNTGTKVNCLKHKLAATIGWTGFHAHGALIYAASLDPFGP